jgi:hypothetical protein
LFSIKVVSTLQTKVSAIEGKGDPEEPVFLREKCCRDRELADGTELFQDQNGGSWSTGRRLIEQKGDGKIVE